MAKGQQRSNREAKKPKAEKPKSAGAAGAAEPPKGRVVFGKRGLAKGKS